MDSLHGQRDILLCIDLDVLWQSGWVPTDKLSRSYSSGAISTKYPHGDACIGLDVASHCVCNEEKFCWPMSERSVEAAITLHGDRLKEGSFFESPSSICLFKGLTSSCVTDLARSTSDKLVIGRTNSDLFLLNALLFSFPLPLVSFTIFFPLFFVGTVSSLQIDGFESIRLSSKDTLRGLVERRR